jgi:hypothetical protein
MHASYDPWDALKLSGRLDIDLTRQLRWSIAAARPARPCAS